MNIFYRNANQKDIDLLINIGSDEYDKKEVGIGYFLDTSHENHGYMTEALIAFCDYVFNAYKYSHIAAMIQPENVASIAVIRKAGFKCVNDIISNIGGFPEPIVQKLFRLPNPCNISI